MVKHCENQDCTGLARDGTVAEFVDALTECLDCGTELVSGPAPAEPDLGLEFNPLKTVFIAGHATHGHVVAAAIESEGIPVYIKGEMLQGAVGELPSLAYQVEIQVPVERADQAREIAIRFESRKLD